MKKRFLLLVVLATAFLQRATAQTNNALNFDGGNDYVTTSGTLLAAGSSYTKEAWVNLSTTSGNLNIISSNGNPFWITGGKLTAGHNTSYFFLAESGTMTANVWTHVAVTYDATATTLKLYKNGSLVGSSTAAPAYTGNAIQLGAHVASSFFNGTMDEVRIWNTVRTEAQIQAAMNAEFCAAQTGLVAYYKMNEAVAGGTNTSPLTTTITDASGNSNTGTLNGFARTGSTSNWITSTIGIEGCSGCGSPVTPSVSLASDDADNSIATGTSVTFTATPTYGGATPTYIWKKNDVVISGQTSATYTTTTLVNGDRIKVEMTSSATCASIPTATSNEVTMQVLCDITISGFLFVSANGTYTLNGTFNGAPQWLKGTTTIYKIQWSGTRWEIIFGSGAGSYNTTGNITNVPCSGWIRISNPVTGGTPLLSSTCGITPIANAYNITGGGASCEGGAGVAIDLGNSETGVNYQLKKDNVDTGSPIAGTGAAISFGNQAAAGIYTIVGTRTLGTCTASMTGSTTVTVTPVVTPSVSIASNDADNTITTGTSVTFTATPTNGGTTPTYQWTKNDINVGNGTATYTTTALANNDVIKCVLTNNETCVSTPTATSSTITMTVSSVLSVEILSFSGKNTEGGNLLTWTTANEVNNKDFQIERLNALGNWEVIGFKTAAPQPPKGAFRTYDFLDIAPPLGAGGAYYRLRQLDNDGKETLSKVISVSQKSNNKLKVYPNPVSNILTIEFGSPLWGLGADVFQIHNLLGQQVMNGKTTQRIDVSALPEGTYFLKVGAEQVKFIKQ